MSREPHLKLLYVTPEGIIKSSVLKDHLTNLYMNEMLARFVIGILSFFNISVVLLCEICI